jgi:hypothetical protein
VKRDLPPYWTSQLIVIIVVFCLGVALFPAAYISYPYTWLNSQNWEPYYTYKDSFEANLTAASPMANVSVGYCDTIEVAARYSSVPVTLRFYNSTGNISAVIPSFGGESTWYPPSVSLHFAVVQNYTVQVEHEAEDTFFYCTIHAYLDTPPPPVLPFFMLFPISYFTIGTFLILFGIVLTSNFIRRTRTFYSTA